MLASVAHQLGLGQVVCILDAAGDRKIECEQGQRNGNDSVGEEHQPLGGRELDLALELGYVTLCLRGSETLGDNFGAGPFLVVARLRPRPPPGQRSGGCCSDPSGMAPGSGRRTS